MKIVNEEHEGPRTFIRFDAHPNPFNYSTGICDNPDCECRNITYYFQEETIPSNPPLCFEVSLNIDTWEAGGPEPRDDQVRVLIAEFMQDLDEETKYEARHIWACNSAIADPKAPRLSRARVREGQMVAWLEVGTEGNHAVMQFSHDGDMYIAFDRYCPNPKCDCRKAHISFSYLDPDGRAKKELFEAELPFHGEPKVKERYACCTAEAKKIVGAWQRRYPKFQELSRRRYERVKEIHAETLASEDRLAPARVAEASPRPNDRCPCGSGKKYKKCCGR